MKSIFSFLEKNTKALFLMSFFIAFALIYILNCFTPLIADDLFYQYSFGAGYAKPIDSFTELIVSQTKHYKIWGGRVVTHALGQVLLQFPPIVFNLLNTMVYFLYIYLMYAMIVGRSNEKKYLLFVLLFFSVWFIIPSYGDTILWLMGSVNYLWGTTIVLLFLLPYRLWVDKKRSLVKIIVYSFFFFISGIIAGWTNENTVVAVLIMLIMFLIYYFKNMQYKPYPLIGGFIGFCIGSYFLLSAPGNFNRAGEHMELSIIVLCYRFYKITSYFITSYGWTLILFPFLLILVSYKKYKTDVFAIIIYVAGAIIAAYVMLASPQFPPRAWFAVVTFIFISIGLLLKHTSAFYIKMLQYVMVVVAVLGFTFTYPQALKDIYVVNKMSKEREVLAKKALENKEVAVYFNRINLQSRYVHDEDLGANDITTYHYGLYVYYIDEK